MGVQLNGSYFQPLKMSWEGYNVTDEDVYCIDWPEKKHLRVLFQDAVSPPLVLSACIVSKNVA